MKPLRKFFLGFLFIGFVLSSIFRVCFSLTNGFEFLRIWLQFLPLKLLDFNRLDAENTYLTTTIVGYLFFLVAGFISLKKGYLKNTKPVFKIVFVLITLYAIYFESQGVVKDLKSEFDGQHLWIGTLLFLYGGLIFYYDKKGSINKDEVKFDQSAIISNLEV